MREFDVDVGDHRLRGKTAPADKQYEALHVAMRTGLIRAMEPEANYSEMAIVAAMGGASFDEVKRLEDLLVGEKLVWRREDEVPLGRNLFVDQIEQYYLVLHRVAVENLGNFWRLRRPQGEDRAAAETS